MDILLNVVTHMKQLLTSDAEIMISLFQEGCALRNYFRENDVFILDRGCRDSFIRMWLQTIYARLIVRRRTSINFTSQSKPLCNDLQMGRIYYPRVQKFNAFCLGNILNKTRLVLIMASM